MYTYKAARPGAMCAAHEPRADRASAVLALSQQGMPGGTLNRVSYFSHKQLKTIDFLLGRRVARGLQITSALPVRLMR